MGIFSGLENMGVKLKDDDLYADDKKQQAKDAPASDAAAAAKKQQAEEADFLLERTYTCPVCGNEFKSLSVKASKAKLVGSDIDLRPRYEQLDTLKYAIIMCPLCGYASMARSFNDITEKQRKLVRGAISSNFHADPHDGPIYSYDEAIRQYQMALANSVVTKAKSSEKAYLCLTMAWVVRGRKESLDKNDPDYASSVKECTANEKELLNNALEGFCNARSTEDFPMCGMDQYTIDYIISALYYECGKFDPAMRLLSELIAKREVNPRIKDRARDLKDLIVEARKRS